MNISSTTKFSGEATKVAGYRVLVSDKAEDPAWDAFLAEVPGGHHVQTSLWAQAKAVLGWQTVRIVVTQVEKIVGRGPSADAPPTCGGRRRVRP